MVGIVINMQIEEVIQMIQIDIPMPKGCWTCPYYKSDIGQTRCMAKSRTGRLIDKTWNLGDARQKWCPIKECDSGGK